MKIDIKNINYRYETENTFCLNMQNVVYNFNGTLGIFGLSGSGKSTLGKVLAGLITRNDINLDFSKAIPFILYSSQMAENIFLGTTVQMNLDFITQNNSNVQNLYAKCEKYLDQFGVNMTKLLPRQGNELSVGELRKFALSLALSCKPDLLILDEPTIGLDLHSKVLFKEILNGYAGEKIVISHDYEILTKLCEEFWIIHEGKLIFQGKREAFENNDEICRKIGLNHYFDRKAKRKNIYNKLMNI